MLAYTWPAVPSLAVYLRNMTCLWKKLAYECRSLVNNNPKIETSQMSLKSRMDQQIVVRSYDGILVSNKESELLSHTQRGVYKFVKSHWPALKKICIVILSLRYLTILFKQLKKKRLHDIFMSYSYDKTNGNKWALSLLSEVYSPW